MINTVFTLGTVRTDLLQPMLDNRADTRSHLHAYNVLLGCATPLTNEHVTMALVPGVTCRVFSIQFFCMGDSEGHLGAHCLRDYRGSRRGLGRESNATLSDSWPAGSEQRFPHQKESLVAATVGRVVGQPSSLSCALSLYIYLSLSLSHTHTHTQ